MPTSKIPQLLDMIQDTADEEIHCDDCLFLVSEFAEAQLTGLSQRDAMRAVEQHLRVCPECREEFDALMQVLATNPV